METLLSTLEKIESSNEFKQFKKQHPDAYFSVGFFVLDYEQNSNQQQLDYSLKNGKVFTFYLNDANKITFKEAEIIKGKEQKIPPLNPNIKVEVDELKEMIEKEMEKQDIQNRINKIIAILQNHENKQIWNLTCMLEGMNLLQVHIDCMTKDIIKFEKRSLFDFIKKIK